MKAGSVLAGAIAIGLLAGAASVVIPSAGSEPRAMMEPARNFTFCHTGGGTNCVVDGDTLWMDGVKIRISDIDAPETHTPKCPEEVSSVLQFSAKVGFENSLVGGPFISFCRG